MQLLNSVFLNEKLKLKKVFTILLRNCHSFTLLSLLYVSEVLILNRPADLLLYTFPPGLFAQHSGDFQKSRKKRKEIPRSLLTSMCIKAQNIQPILRLRNSTISPGAFPSFSIYIGEKTKQIRELILYIQAVQAEKRELYTNIEYSDEHAEAIYICISSHV